MALEASHESAVFLVKKKPNQLRNFKTGLSSRVKPAEASLALTKLVTLVKNYYIDVQNTQLIVLKK